MTPVQLCPAKEADTSLGPSPYDALLGFTQITLALVGFLIIVATLVWQYRHHFAMPIYDELFDRLRLYRALGDHKALLAHLIALHNEHRILTTRLFGLLDELVFAGREHVQVVATNVLQLGGAALTYFLVFCKEPCAGWTLPARALALSAITLLFVNPSILYTLVVPFQLQHAIMGLLCVSASIIMAHAPADNNSPRAPLVLGFALVVLAVLATFSLGNAPVILIGCAATALVLRWRAIIILAFAALAIAHASMIIATTSAVGTKSTDLLEIVKFALIYLGSPFMRIEAWPAPFVTWWWSAWLAAGIGALVLATALMFGIARLVRPGLGGRVAVFGFMLLVMVIVTGLAAGHSRAQFGILEGASRKYASFAALGWLGTMAIICGVTRDLVGRYGLAITVTPLTLIAAAIVAFSLSAQWREPLIWQKAIDRNWEAALAVFIHVNARDRLADLYTEWEPLAEFVNYIESTNRSIFARFPFRHGDSAAQFLSTRAEAACKSEVETFGPIPEPDGSPVFTDPGRAVSFSGWTWMTEERGPPQAVIAVDAANRIVGVAAVTRTSSRIEEWLGQKFSVNYGWFGFARLADTPSVSFVALGKGYKSFCRLGAPGNVR
ncbi:MAG: hypothetical protein ACJ8F3_02890 [Xanthobacteraceae bacterium]